MTITIKKMPEKTYNMPADELQPLQAYECSDGSVYIALREPYADIVAVSVCGNRLIGKWFPLRFREVDITVQVH